MQIDIVCHIPSGFVRTYFVIVCLLGSLILIEFTSKEWTVSPKRLNSPPRNWRIGNSFSATCRSWNLWLFFPASEMSSPLLIQLIRQLVNQVATSSVSHLINWSVRQALSYLVS